MGGKKKYINIFGSFTEPFNCSSTDVFFATAVDIICCVLHFVLHILICIYYILSDLISFHFLHYNWMEFVRLNKRHVILCSVMLYYTAW